MGFFSWKTADTKESIPNIHSSEFIEGRHVYWIQPEGKPPLVEEEYEGYGTFANIDVYDWLVDTNFPGLADELGIDKRILGVNLIYGHVMKVNDQYWYCTLHHEEKVLKHFLGDDAVLKPFGRYDDFVCVDGINASVNDHAGSGRLTRTSLVPELKYPLKFSFNPAAKYEDLPASEDCEYQGYFY